jgi:hypothetical protein
MNVRAEKTGSWRSCYEISADGRPLTCFDGSTWRSGGRFTLDDRAYTVSARRFGSSYVLADEAAGPGAAPLAVAHRVGNREWTVAAAGREYRFRRTSFWRGDQELLGPDGPVGGIRCLSPWRGGAVAELPGLATPLQVFVVAVVLCMWEAQTAAATS